MPLIDGGSVTASNIVVGEHHTDVEPIEVCWQRASSVVAVSNGLRLGGTKTSLMDGILPLEYLVCDGCACAIFAPC